MPKIILPRPSWNGTKRKRQAQRAAGTWAERIRRHPRWVAFLVGGAGLIVAAAVAVAVWQLSA